MGSRDNSSSGRARGWGKVVSEGIGMENGGGLERAEVAERQAVKVGRVLV